MNRIDSSKSILSKCSWAVVLLVLLAQNTLAAVAADEGKYLEGNDEYSDVDNVEWHHVKIVDGVMHESHPVVMYKEDFVNEDYVPKINKTQHESSAASDENAKQQNLRHKDISKLRKHLQRGRFIARNEKRYFDVLPEESIALASSAQDDAKFDPSKIRAELLPIDEKTGEEQQANKSKHPKKYRHRLRRDLSALANEHRIHKRNPYLRSDHADNAVSSYLQQFFDMVRRQQFEQRNSYNKIVVPGKRWNSLDSSVPALIPEPIIGERFGGEDNVERVVWGRVSRRPNAIPTAPTKRPLNPLIRDPRPSNNPANNPPNIDYSIFNTGAQELLPPTTAAPTRRPLSPLIRDLNTQNPASSFRPVATTTTPPPRQQPAMPAAYSPCVIAIVNCCSTRNSQIRYNCFEQYNCNGAFWDINPCATEVFENVINYFEDQ